MKFFWISVLFTLPTLVISCGEKEGDQVEQAKSLVVLPSSPIPENFAQDFSGEKALLHIRALTEFGPRPPESDGYRNSLIYLEETLGKFGWKTSRQSFRSATPIGQVGFTNLIARFSPKSDVDWENSVPFVIGSHLDTKRFISITFLGVNDSGSSTGVLVEMARVLSAYPKAAKQIELVFFDGEEAMLTNIDPKRDGLYGSRYYAAELTRRKSKPYVGMVLDLVGDVRVPLLVGLDSPKLLKQHALVAAKSLGMDQETVQPARIPIIDDHIPLLNRANLQTLHLIGDFNRMPYWHTENDTLEQISAEGLSNSGKLTFKVLSQISK